MADSVGGFGEDPPATAPTLPIRVRVVATSQHPHTGTKQPVMVFSCAVFDHSGNKAGLGGERLRIIALGLVQSHQFPLEGYTQRLRLRVDSQHRISNLLEI